MKKIGGRNISSIPNVMRGSGRRSKPIETVKINGIEVSGRSLTITTLKDNKVTKKSSDGK